MESSNGNMPVGRRYVSAEQIEDVVRQLKDVVSARAVLDPIGRIAELHALVNPRRAPKQVARDIESGLKAHLDVDLDYRKISIAQIQNRSVFAGSAERRRLRFSDVSLTVSGTKAEACVHLTLDDKTQTGLAAGHASTHNQLRLIASATLRAVEDSGTEDGSMVIEDVSGHISLAGRQAVVVLVSALATGKGEELLTGSALVRQDIWKAVVNATLDAVNRRLARELIDED